jgi:putative addiction module component (TIGR02574 family)
MVAENLIRDALSLPADDRMELCTRLCESLQGEPGTPPLSPAQTEELDRRYSSYLRNSDEGYTVEEVDAMLKLRRNASCAEGSSGRRHMAT